MRGCGGFNVLDAHIHRRAALLFSHVEEALVPSVLLAFRLIDGCDDLPPVTSARRTEFWIAAAALATFLFPAGVRAGSCDFVLRWDEQTIASCFKEMKSESWMLGMKVQNLETENHILRGHLCLVAGELKRMGSSSELTALVIEDACADLRAAAKKRSTTPAKSNLFNTRVRQ